jgi:gluconolactonase
MRPHGVVRSSAIITLALGGVKRFAHARRRRSARLLRAKSTSNSRDLASLAETARLPSSWVRASAEAASGRRTSRARPYLAATPRGFMLTHLLVAFVACSVGEPSGDAAILPEHARLEQLWNQGRFTEGVAAGPDGAMYFSDIGMDGSPGRIYRFDPATRETTVYCEDSQQSNGLMFDRAGRLIACCGANHGGQCLAEITREGEVRPIVSEYQGRRFNAPNDLVIHPNGAIYFSDPRYLGPEPMEIDHMSVYRYDPVKKTVVRVTRDITKPNGVVLSPDAKTLYVAETDNRTVSIDKPAQPDAQPRMTLNAFPVLGDGTHGPKRVLVDYGKKLGIDGMTVDVEGNLYAAVRSEDRYGIVVYTPKGEDRAYIPTPELPTNCCFGIGEESTVLYVTAGTGLYRIALKIAGYHPASADPS